jgi:hypothetical protein
MERKINYFIFLFLSKMKCSSVGCSLAQWKNIQHWRAEFGPKGRHLISGNNLFFILGGAAKLRWVGGAQRPVGRGNEPKKKGAHSARARTRGQNPLVVNIFIKSRLFLENPQKTVPFS